MLLCGVETFVVNVIAQVRKATLREREGGKKTKKTINV